jgi:excisionase family DNA binding protein
MAAAPAFKDAVGQAEVPTERDISLARKSSVVIARHLHDPRPLSVRIPGKHQEYAELPAAAVRPILELLKHMAQGTPVTMVPLRALLTTQEAADLLRVSRPHLVKLLETGKIPFKKVGTHRRIEYSAVVNYQRERDKSREAAMEELSAIAQEHQMDR